MSGKINLAAPGSLWSRLKDGARGCSPQLVLSWLFFATVVGWMWVDSRLPYPYIFGDETGFMIPARAVADPAFLPGGGGLAFALHSQSPVHSVLFSTTFNSGDGFFAHAKFINCLLCGLMIFPAYLLARRVTSTGPAIAFAALVAINPWNSYTAHFMPETLYAFLFWWLAWACLRSAPDDNSTLSGSLVAAGGCGILGALLFFTKPHGFTLLAACVGTFLLRGLRSGLARSPRWWLGFAQAAVFALVVFVCFVGFSHASDRSLSDVFFAGRYQGQAGNIFSLENFGVKLQGFVRQTTGHFSHAAVLYAVPLAAVGGMLWLAVRPMRAAEERTADTIAFIALATVLTVGVTIKFACDVMLTEDPGLIHRLSERYYGFLVPLIALPLFASPSHIRGIVPSVLAVLFAIAAAVSIVIQRSWFQINAYDAPQFYWLSPAAAEGRPVSLMVWLVLALAAAHVAYFVLSRRYDWRAFVVLSVAVGCIATAGLERQKQRESRGPNAMHSFALMTRFVVKSDWRHTVLVGDPYLVLCFEMMLDGLPTSVILPPDVPLPPERVPAGTNWIIRVRPHPMPGLKTESVFHNEGNEVFDISRVLP